MSTPTQDLAAAGVSIWLDDLSRARIASGNLADLISSRNVSGVTTNPSIFQAAIGNQNDDSYDAPWPRWPKGRGRRGDLRAHDDRRRGRRRHLPRRVRRDGRRRRPRVDRGLPDLAHDTDATVAEAQKLWAKVDRPTPSSRSPRPRRACPRSPRSSPRASRST
jgi:transaldolase